MQYDYATEEPKDSKKPYMILASVVIGLIVVGFGIGLTGQVTGICSDFNDCKAKAVSSQSSLEACNKQVSGLTESKNDAEFLLAKCENSLADAEKFRLLYADEKNAYKGIVDNTAAALCCTEADVNRGAIKGFNIVSNSVRCGPGEFAVNCKLGTSNYQP